MQNCCCHRREQWLRTKGFVNRFCPCQGKDGGPFRVLHDLTKPICSSPSKIAIFFRLFSLVKSRVALCMYEVDQSQNTVIKSYEDSGAQVDRLKGKCYCCLRQKAYVAIVVATAGALVNPQAFLFLLRVIFLRVRESSREAVAKKNLFCLSPGSLPCVRTVLKSPAVNTFANCDLDEFKTEQKVWNLWADYWCIDDDPPPGYVDVYILNFTVENYYQYKIQKQGMYVYKSFMKSHKSISLSLPATFPRRRYSTKFLYGVLRPEVHPLTFCIPL